MTILANTMPRRLKYGKGAVFVLALLLMSSLLIPTAPVAVGAPPDHVPDPRGQAAIDRLGERLPAVARAYGLSAAKLRARFLNDNSLSVDIEERLFYVDPAYDPDSASGSEQSSAEAPPTTDPVFTLHSRPGADYVIYLDFDGHITTGTPWNSNYNVSTIVSPPYDIDGDPNSWNGTELSRIGNTWKIVTEDFAPFDIDVTTEEPPLDRLIKSGGGDTQWGVRAVITDDTWANCGCGGHAYINSFGYNTDTPAFVYNSSLLGVAEASSHEVGHSVGLSHDGTSNTTYYSGHGSGEASWAPLMGVGYYEDVTQWSKGEYYDSNNAGSGGNYGDGPDDLLIMTTQFGFDYRVDDHGNGSTSASPLSGVDVSASGVIERFSDIDVFGFSTGPGPVSLAIDPDTLRPNLNIRATLRDSGGNQVAVSDPTSTLSASFNQSLSAGTYYLEVEGTGTGSPLNSSPTGYTEYATLGQYTVTGNLTTPTGGIEVMSWVPPYGIGASQSSVQADLGACDVSAGLTRIGLQFWTPNDDGTIKYADHESYVPTDTDVGWWRNWGQANDIDILLTVYNNNGSWNWPLARSAFDTNRTAFVNALVAEMERLNLDGIDIDLEGLDGEIIASDRAAFDLFIHDLSVELKSRGKILTVNSFHYIWNAPNHDWWADWVDEVDNIHSMGYADLYEGGTTWHKYSFQQNAGFTAGYPGDTVLMGLPSWLGSWGTSSGRGTTAQAHVQEVHYDLPEPTGIAIWDLHLTAWQNSDLWCEIRNLKSALNNPPVAADDTATTWVDTMASTDVLANDSDPDGDPISVDSFTQPSNGSVTIGAGGLLDYTPNPAFYGADSFTYTVSDGQGGADTATVNVTVQQPPPTVQVTATDTTAAEAGAETATFTLSRTGETTSALNVLLSITGSATNGDDYQTISSLPTIPEGSSSTLITVSPIDDTEVEPDETVTLTITPDNAYTAGAANSAVITITSDDLPPPNVDDLAMSEASSFGSVTAGNFASSHSSDGQAENLTEELYGGGKRSRLEHRWTFNVTGGDSVTFFVEAYHNSFAEDFRFEYSSDGSIWTTMLTIIKSTNDDATQSFELPSSTDGTLLVRVVDTDRSRPEGTDDSLFVDHMYIRSTSGAGLPQVTLAVTDDTAGEYGPDSGRTTVTRTGDTASNLTVTYSVGGTADNGFDHQFLSGELVILAGESQGDITIIPVDDLESEGSETVVITLALEPAYSVGSPSSGTVTIADDESVDVKDRAYSDNLIYGTLIYGSFANTDGSDNVYQEIQEELYGGKKRSRLEHRWTFDVTGGDSVTFFVEAHHSGGEDFQLEYSTNQSTWISMLTIAGDTDPDPQQSYLLPQNTSGLVLVRVVDGNRSRGDKSTDTIFIDDMFIQSKS